MKRSPLRNIPSQLKPAAAAVAMSIAAMEKEMDSKVTLQNKMNALRQQIEQDRVAKMQQELSIKDGESLPDDMPKESREALTHGATAARIQLAMIDRRLATREPALSALEEQNEKATT